MTVGTPISNRFVLPQEWPALLAVTFCTRVVDRGLRQQGLGVGAMGIMTVGTGHQALEQRVVAAQIELRAFLQMAAHAQFNTGLSLWYQIAGLVNLVTAGAGEAGEFVFAASPVQALAGLVAAQALGVLRRNVTGRDQPALEDDSGGLHRPIMCGTRPMAALTLMLGEWCPGIGLQRMDRIQYRCDGRICVTGEAGGRTLRGILRLGVDCIGGLCGTARQEDSREHADACQWQ